MFSLLLSPFACKIGNRTENFSHCFYWLIFSESICSTPLEEDMFKSVKRFLKKILGFFAVNKSGYKIEALPETANERGEVYKLMPPSGSPRLVYAIRNEDGIYDLSWAGYVTIEFSGKLTSRGRKEVKITKVEEELSQEDHDALAEYFDNHVIRRYPLPRGKETKPLVSAKDPSELTI